MERFERAFVTLNRGVVGLILAAVFAIVFVNVVLRYGFGRSLSWGEESARFLMVAGAYLGAGLALREGRLVAINALIERLPDALRLAMRYAIAALMIVFMLAVVWIGLRFAVFGADKLTMATEISRAIPYSAIPIGAAVFVVHGLLFLRRFVHMEFEGDDAVAGAAPVDESGR
ncbi:MAG: TRAP transporter small permease [Burkholderiales bacterium]|nr:MAG: TRAP transporter small permease [Burkholderiales bacterium]